MDETEAISKINIELGKAKKKHPNWPNDLLHQVAIVNEESGEVTKATLHYIYEGGSKDEIQKELIQTAAMCIRMLKNL